MKKLTIALFGLILCSAFAVAWWQPDGFVNGSGGIPYVSEDCTTFTGEVTDLHGVWYQDWGAGYVEFEGTCDGEDYYAFLYIPNGNTEEGTQARAIYGDVSGYTIKGETQSQKSGEMAIVLNLRDDLAKVWMNGDPFNPPFTSDFAVYQIPITVTE